MRFCPFCSAENADELAVCAACGRRLPPLPPRRARNAPPTGIQLPTRTSGTTAPPPLRRSGTTVPPPGGGLGPDQRTAITGGVGSEPRPALDGPTVMTPPPILDEISDATRLHRPANAGNSDATRVHPASLVSDSTSVHAPSSPPVGDLTRTSVAVRNPDKAPVSSTLAGFPSGPAPAAVSPSGAPITLDGDGDDGKRSLLAALSPGPAAQRREAPPPEPRGPGDASRRRTDDRPGYERTPAPDRGAANERSSSIPSLTGRSKSSSIPPPTPHGDAKPSPPPPALASTVAPHGDARGQLDGRGSVPHLPPPPIAPASSPGIPFERQSFDDDFNTQHAAPAFPDNDVSGGWPNPPTAVPSLVPKAGSARVPLPTPSGAPPPSPGGSLPSPASGGTPGGTLPSLGSGAAPRAPLLPPPGGAVSLPAPSSASRPLVITSTTDRSSGVTPPPTRAALALADRPFTPPRVLPVPETPEPGLLVAAKYTVRFARARYQRRGAIKTLGVEIKQDTEALDQVLGALGRVARNVGVEGRVFSAENTAITQAEERIAALGKELGEVDSRKGDENSKFMDVERERNTKLGEAERLVDEAQKELAHLDGQRRALREARKTLERRQKAYLKAAEDNDKQSGSAQMGDSRGELRRSAEMNRKEAAAIEPERQDTDRRIAALERPISEATARLDAAKAELDAAKRSLADVREGHTHRLAELDAEQKRKAREIGLAEGEISRRMVTLGTLINLNRIEHSEFLELYERIDRLRGAITSRTTEIEKLAAEREAYDKGTITRGLAAMGGAVIAFIALIVILRAIF